MNKVKKKSNFTKLYFSDKLSDFKQEKNSKLLPKSETYTNYKINRSKSEPITHVKQHISTIHYFAHSSNLSHFKFILKKNKGSQYFQSRKVKLNRISPFANSRNSMP